jgi:hypothetical protein
VSVALRPHVSVVWLGKYLPLVSLSRITRPPYFHPYRLSKFLPWLTYVAAVSEFSPAVPPTSAQFELPSTTLPCRSLPLASHLGQFIVSHILLFVFIFPNHVLYLLINIPACPFHMFQFHSILDCCFQLLY